MSNLVVSFTGHRRIDEIRAAASIDHLLKELCPSSAIVGGAAGADTLAAERCLRLEIPYVMALPHPDYPFQYKLMGDNRWHQTFWCAEEIRYVVKDKPWHFSHNFKRNEWMVDNSGLLISISTFDPYGEIPDKGGTAHCVRYARKVERKIEWAVT